MAAPDTLLAPPGSILAEPPPDCGQKSLVFTFVNLLTGNIQAVDEVSLEVTPGQGMLLLDPPTLPMVGEITDGTLVICSEFFPALAPLRMQLTGTDMRFLVQNGRVVNYGWRQRERTLMRIQCTPTPNANVTYRLEVPQREKIRRVLLHREELTRDERQLDRRTLAFEVLRGQLRGLTRPIYQGTRAIYERLDILRDKEGVLELRLLASWFELSFHKGALRRVRCFEERGLVASIALLGAHRFGGAHSVAFRDVLA